MTETLPIEFDAALTKDDVFKGEEVAESWGVTRRCALVTLTQGSAQQLENMDTEMAEALVEVVERVTEYLKWREHETELLETAQARILVVLQAFSDKHPTV